MSTVKINHFLYRDLFEEYVLWNYSFYAGCNTQLKCEYLCVDMFFRPYCVLLCNSECKYFNVP